ncbi:DUF4179 domain-containing protein [Robertmurraya siralis]|uniref:DUF4179 domain-containing protein n=1 Tax=Robertmurraya siralis TaxID=77777 RepID=UPI000BA58AD4|nr:DUF4179 domain-containing protein [Robertmurraya siralis]PAE19925.1 hypothetical protein CHH80_14155 [Bacillus sp. 7504-2]
MNCPVIDKLSQYVDNLLEEEEMKEIEVHVEKCKDCATVVEALEQESLFLQETLKNPTLPDNFEALVLGQLEPYEQGQKQKRGRLWKRGLIAAATIFLAFGVTTKLHPSFAEWVGGLFSTEQVDEGLRMASDAGFAKRVNAEVTDQGLTFKVEDVVADASRIALSYQVLNEDGKFHDPDFTEYEIYGLDQNGKRLEVQNVSWGYSEDDYGIMDFSLRNTDLEQFTLKLQITDLSGIKGNWELEIPIDLRESLKFTEKLALHDFATSSDGVELKLKEVRLAPSTNEIVYETAFTDDERNRIETEVQKLESRFGKDIAHTFTNFGTAIQYHLEDQKENPVYYQNSFLDGQGHPNSVGLIQGIGESLSQFGSVAWNEYFVPKKSDQEMTFVLDGVIKTVPADFSITVKPMEQKQNPISFEYEGNYMVLKKVKMENEYSLQKLIIPFKKEKKLKIEMEGGREATATEFGQWVLVDQNGKVYQTYGSGGVSDEKDENGRYKTTVELTIYNLEEVPEEFTLHLISVTRFHKLDEKWKVPLY